MENTINTNSNIKISEERISRQKHNEKATRVINKDNKVIKNVLLKFLFQIFFCIVLITSIWIYKVFDKTGFEHNVSKYNWILNYSMSYIDTYNWGAKFLNNKFSFNIPLKEKIVKEVNDTVVIENTEENIVATVDNENVVQVSTPYNNMEIMANEIKEKYIWIKPTEGTISCEFGNRDASRPDISTFHLGLDIANETGTEIFAATSGVVSTTSYNEVYGNHIKIVKDDVITIYAHCSKILVKENQQIKEGDKIGLMGQTGVATGSHLHFEVRKNNMVINPEYILNFR